MTDETTRTPVADPLVGTTFDGRYAIVRKIGTGGMANVYLANDQTLGRAVAIKVLNPTHAADAQFVERFLREASSAARLNHPNIVQVYDRGQAAGTYYIAMEYVEGESLKALIRRDGPFTEHRAIEFARQALAALRFAHRNGIVHRDIKPHNMLIDAEGRLKIADFGIARAGADHGLTEVGSIVGTAQYLSPEQARGEVVAASSDLYSLGVVLFEMATGRVPFDGDQPVNVALKHVNAEVPRPRSLQPTISPQLEAVILRALEKNPDLRFQTADAFLQDIDAVEAGEITSETAAITRVLTPVPAAALTPPPAMTDAARSAYASSAWDNDEAGEDEESTKRRWWIWLLVAVVLTTAGVVGFMSLRGGEKVAVPDVVGMTTEEATAELEQAGLEVGEESKRFSSEAEGTVVDTDPGADTKVEEGSIVDLVVSGGEEPIEVPDFVGSTLTEAQRDARDAGLTLQVREVFDDRVEKGTVISQSPRAGDEVDPGSRVRVEVSKGPKAITIPAVTGTSVDAATRRLEAAGFRVRTVEADSSQARNTVTEQRPAAGTEAENGATVTLTVASGFNLVPSLIEQSEDEATDAVGAAGFRIRITEETAEDPSLPLDGKVTAQVPDGGERLEVGSQVSVTITRPAQDAGPVDAGGTDGL